MMDGSINLSLDIPANERDDFIRRAERVLVLWCTGRPIESKSHSVCVSHSCHVGRGAGYSTVEPQHMPCRRMVFVEVRAHEGCSPS